MSSRRRLCFQSHNPGGCTPGRGRRHPCARLREADARVHWRRSGAGVARLHKVVEGSLFVGSMSASGNLDVRWIHGSPSRRRQTDPPWQVHRYRDDTVIMRQSKDVTYEAPFTFLLFGTERALLLDTGAVNDDLLRRIVDKLIAEWLTSR